MKQGLRLIASILLLIIVCRVPSYGWGPKGHMMVAAVAYDQLTPTAKAKVNQLVGMNIHKSILMTHVQASASPALKKKMLFMVAATWPDIIKSRSDYTKDGSHDGNRPPDSPTASQNIGYTDHLMHKYWHFIDEPFGGTLGIPVPNAKDRLELFITTLGSNKPNQLKSYDLCWMLHLIGDVHQPLHCITRITPGDLDGDDGGNDVTFSSGQSLHSFWDGIVGGGDAASTALSAVSSLPTADPTEASDLNVQHWIDESFRLRTSVYRNPIGPGLGPFPLTDGYRTDSLKIAQERIALAGARLAKILNEKLG